MKKQIGFTNDLGEHKHMNNYLNSNNDLFYRVGLPNGDVINGVIKEEVAGKIILLPHLVSEKFCKGRELCRLETKIPAEVYTPTFKQPINKEVIMSYISYFQEFSNGEGI